jgi:hypothetical protein
MSAIRDESFEPIQVLITMHDNMNLLDFSGPLQVITHAQHDFNNPGTLLGHLVVAYCCLTRATWYLLFADHRQ